MNRSRWQLVVALVSAAAGSQAGCGGEGPDGPGGDWTPFQLQEVVLWLDADEGISTVDGNVDLWTDLSGLDNNASQIFADAMPTLTPSAVAGRAAATFNGQTSFLTVSDVPSMQWGTGDYALFVVARCSNADVETDRMLYHKTEVASPFNGVHLFLNPYFGTMPGQAAAQDNANVHAGSATGGYNDSTFRLYAGRRVGTTLQIRVNGTVVGQTTESPAINLDAPGRDAVIGHNGSPNIGQQALKGDIAEIIAVKGVLSDANLAKLESYLRTKYAL
jgi:hypothetical protein